MDIEFFSAQIISILQATPKIKVFRLLHNRSDYYFFPGQWIDLEAPIEGKNIGGYTIISSTETKNYIDLAIRESQNHPVTKYLHESVKVGDSVLITKGQGKFYLEKELMDTPLTFIAGGIGLTPILSMIRSLKSTEKIKLVYSVGLESEILFKEELKAFTRFIITKDGEKKRFIVEELNLDLNSSFFICGPKSMIDETVSKLLALGLPKAKIHYEKWW